MDPGLPRRSLSYKPIISSTENDVLVPAFKQSKLAVFTIEDEQIVSTDKSSDV